jgi:hypothetical protein
MEKISGLEGKVLKKYLKKRVVDPEDTPYIKRMTSIGLMNIGYSFKEEKRTAETTYSGRKSV